MSGNRHSIGFGDIDMGTVSRWMALDPAADGPVWMVNLMKYRPVARYSDGRATTLSGKEADDAYAPLGPLAAVGAMVALHGDVVDQSAGQPQWDRVAIVRYPSRRSFFEMQQRDDFKKQYVHKEAGMDFTIVMGCRPAVLSGPPPAGAPLVVRIRRFAPGARPGPDPAGTVPVARFSVDGVVIGDQRAWDDVCLDAAGPEGPAAFNGTEGVEEQMIVSMTPAIDALVRSVETAPEPD